MITNKTIQRMAKDYGTPLTPPEAKEVSDFLEMYYKEMQLWGVYLNDVEIEELNPCAKLNLVESSLKLWITAKMFK